MKILAQYLETIVAFILGAVFFLVQKPELAYVSLIIGPSLTTSRFLFSKKIEEETALIRSKIVEEMSQIHRLAGIVDLYSDLPVDKLKDIVTVYLKVEPEFRQVKETILSEAAQKLLKLAQQKTSELLTTSNYYNWLLPKIEEATIGSEIWAISMMLDFEWDDSPSEERFLRLNMEAARRGVRLERIFVVSSNDLSKMATNPGVMAHMKENTKAINALVVSRELLENREPSLLKEINDGMIAFDRRVALIDTSSPDGIRGYLTTNATEIDKLRKTYENLRTYARDMKTVLSTVNTNVVASSGPISIESQPEGAPLKIQQRY